MLFDRKSNDQIILFPVPDSSLHCALWNLLVDDDVYDCVDIEEDGGEIDLDISKIVDISLREKLVESYLLIEKINAFSLSPPIPISPIFCPSSTIPVVDLDLPLEEADVPSFSDDSILRGIESDRDSGEDTTSIDALPLDDSMILSEYESFTFDDEPVMAEVNVFDEINYNMNFLTLTR
ncbi:hypothetical protein Tco_0604698 [Tanacetum coccineum]